MRDEGLLVEKDKSREDSLSLYSTTVNNAMLESLPEPVANPDPLYSWDGMVYSLPRELQRVRSESMVEQLRESENVIYGDGRIGVFPKEEIPLWFDEILPISKGRIYLESDIHIGHPNAEEELAKFKAEKGIQG